jgi:hypothetical protein
LRDGQGVKQTEMLKHHADTQLPRLLGIANMYRLAIEKHIAMVGCTAP